MLTPSPLCMQVAKAHSQLSQYLERYRYVHELIVAGHVEFGNVIFSMGMCCVVFVSGVVSQSHTAHG